jgi:hypothetical protein
MLNEHVPPHPDAVKTTRTLGGQLVDWIPIESQVHGGKVATPPPSGPAQKKAVTAEKKAATGHYLFELENPSAERGPKGTVPILRGLLAHRDRVKRLGADKKGPRMHSEIGKRILMKGEIAPPNPDGYYHASSSQLGTFFGGSSDMTSYAPILQNGQGHSIYQLWLLGGTPMQSVEVGWTVDHGLNGDLQPHLFTYYTTNGYAKDGDNLGGYNRLNTGWVQISPNVFPGSALTPSHIGQYVNRYTLLVMLWQSNWWLKIEDTWVGYYPASLFGSGVMSRQASRLDFGGEVYSGLPNPALSTSQMGSGRKGEHGSNGYSGWHRNILARTLVDANGGHNEDFSGTASAEDSSRYDIVQTMRSTTNWGSFLFAGGSGKGAEP